MDEFNDQSGIDTAENVGMTYDSASDFYSGGAGVTPGPPTQDITSFTSTSLQHILLNLVLLMLMYL